MPGTTAAATSSAVKTATRATDCAVDASTSERSGTDDEARGTRRGPPRPGCAGCARACCRSRAGPYRCARTTAGHYGAGMLAAYAVRQSADDPLSGLEVGERPDPQPRGGWTTVTLRAAGAQPPRRLVAARASGLPADRLPMILGCDGAGVDEDGNEVIVHAVVPSDGLARRRDPRPAPHAAVRAARRHAGREGRSSRPATSCRSPSGLSVGDAACLSTAWLTAYRMLFTNSGVQPGGDGAGPGRRRRGGHGARPARRGGGLPDVGHLARRGEGRARGGDRRGPRLRRPASGCPTGSTRSWRPSAPRRGPTRSTRLRPGGTIVISGATSGDAPAKAELTKIFFKQLRVVGLDDGHPRRARAAGPVRRAAAASSRSSTRSCRWPRPATASPGWSTATSSARSSSPSDAPSGSGLKPEASSQRMVRCEPERRREPERMPRTGWGRVVRLRMR